MITIYALQGIITLDEIDIDLVGENWSINENGKGYAQYQKNGKKIKLHKIIAERMNLFGQIDHKDKNKTNNCRNNLRLITNQQNALNSVLKIPSSGYRGVYWHNQALKYMAAINSMKRFKCLGLYSDKIEAAKAYDKEAIKIYGNFAILNFPTQGR